MYASSCLIPRRVPTRRETRMGTGKAKLPLLLAPWGNTKLAGPLVRFVGHGYLCVGPDQATSSWWGDFSDFSTSYGLFEGSKIIFIKKNYHHQIRRPRVVVGGAWGRGVMTTAGCRAGTWLADIFLREFI